MDLESEKRRAQIKERSCVLDVLPALANFLKQNFIPAKVAPLNIV